MQRAWLGPREPLSPAQHAPHVPPQGPAPFRLDCWTLGGSRAGNGTVPETGGASAIPCRSTSSEPRHRAKAVTWSRVPDFRRRETSRSYAPVDSQEGGAT